MATNYSACYRVSGSNSFTSEYFSDKQSAVNLACEMSKRTPGYMAYVHKNIGDWINGVFYESKTTTVAVYIDGKQR